MPAAEPGVLDDHHCRDQKGRDLNRFPYFQMGGLLPQKRAVNFN
jgi:hypothetical protein